MLASGRRRERRRRRRKTQSEPESKMLIKLIELSLSSGEHSHTESARPNGSLILGAKGFLQERKKRGRGGLKRSKNNKQTDKQTA